MSFATTNNSNADLTSDADFDPMSLEGGRDNDVIKRDSERQVTNLADADVNINAIATAGGGSSVRSSSIGGAANSLDTSRSMVSLTIPMFKPLHEYRGAIDSSSEVTPNASWVGFKVMAKIDEISDEWNLCEIKSVAIDKKTSQPQFDVKASVGGDWNDRSGIPVDKLKRLFLEDVNINLDDYNALLSAYNNHGGVAWKHNVFYTPGARNYLQLLEGFEKKGLYLGIDEVDEKGGITSLNFDCHVIEGEFLKSLSMLSQVRSLSVECNRLSVIPDSLGRLTSLHELNLSHNCITVIPKCLGELSKLQRLGLCGNNITVIPECFAKLLDLHELDLSWNEITAIPECFGQLSSLNDLDLFYNQITVIPEWLGQLSNLNRLNLCYNQISVIPECLGQLSNLNELRLSRNQITIIPEYLGQVSNLKNLDISSNQIAVIPECIGQLSNLNMLSLSWNQVTTISISLGQLSNLYELDLSGNRIKIIPECLCQLSNLNELYLNSNQITVIPDSLGKLSNLKNLKLSSNRIAAIPECLDHLSNLSELDISNNIKLDLSLSCFLFAKLINLSDFQIAGSSLVSMTEDAIETDNFHILECLFEDILGKFDPAGSKVIFNNDLVLSFVDLLFHKFIYIDVGFCIELSETLDLEGLWRM